jgi:hypothetical protein
MNSLQQTERILRRLYIVRLTALVDLVLLIILVSAALTGKKEIVHVVGPLHGINFLLLLVIVGVAALDGVWGWWFPVAILLTAGPPGAFIGEWVIHRRVRAQKLRAIDDLSSEATVLATAKEEADASDSFSLVTQDERKEHL